MTRLQKNKQVMGSSVTQTLDQSQQVWQGSQVFSDTVQDHKDNMTDISHWEIKQQQAMDIKGLVLDKKLLRILITTEMVRIISGIKAYAASINNNELAESVNYSKGKLLVMSDTAFLTAADKVKVVANANAAAIVPFGITAPILASYALDITAFDTISKKPKAMRGQVKVFTANLKDAVSKMMENLKQNLDNMVRSLFPATDFEAAYFNSRIIYHYNENRTELRGTATDNATGKHVRNVIIELVNYPAPGESIFRHTNKDGNYSFRQLDLTTATIRIRAIGYTTAEYTVPIVQGSANDFDILLIPEPAPVTVPA